MQILPCPTVRRWKQSSSEGSFHRTSTLSAKQSRTRSPRLSCTFSLITAKRLSKIDSSVSCIRRIYSPSFCTKTTASKLNARNVRSCLRRTKRPRRLWGRSCETPIRLISAVFPNISAMLFLNILLIYFLQLFSIHHTLLAATVPYYFPCVSCRSTFPLQALFHFWYPTQNGNRLFILSHWAVLVA